MKTVRSIALLLMVGIIMFGACGCMDKKTYENEISNIKGIVEQRYGQEFSIEYFLPAKDKTYDSILTLSNKEGVVFNAYQRGDSDEITDDYPEALINAKLTDYISTSVNVPSSLKVSVLGILRDGSSLTVDSARKYSGLPSHQEYIKLITVISLNANISEHKNELYNIYTEVLKFESDLIEFEVVSLLDPGEELSKILNNPLGYYDNNWEDYDEISDYIDITSKLIASADELVKEAK